MANVDVISLKRRTAWLSVVSNSLLVILKLVVGIYVGAVSLISEAMHSGVDLIAAAIAFWAVRKAVAPPDKGHDYGHGKFENLSSAVEALLIVATAVFIIYEAVNKFNTPIDPEFLQYGIYIMLISIVVNLAVSQRLISVAKKTGSQALEADGLHLRADVWTSVGVVLGLIGMKIFGFLWLDPVIAIAVALIIFRAGYKMVVESAKELTDTSLSSEEELVIGNLLLNNPVVDGFHCLRTRHSGSEKLIDVHVTFDENLTLSQVHKACDDVENQIKAKLGDIDITIHPEPVKKKPLTNKRIVLNSVHDVK